MLTKKIFFLLIISLSIISLPLISCTSSGGGDDSSEADNNNENSDSTGTQVRLLCGAVKNDQLINPVSQSDGEVVQIVRAADHNGLVVRTQTGGEILVKLHGIDNQPAAFLESAISFINGFSGSAALFIKAGENCPATLSGGGLGQLGQIILSSGQSLSEELARRGFANSTQADACSSALVAGCFSALQESDPVTAGELDAFLWKPVADSDANLAVHTGPFGTTVIVNGEVGRNQGPGNGYGSLARFSKPGCAYANPQIVVRANDGSVYTLNGQSTLTVGNPCQRHCLIGGQIVACTK